MNRGDLVIVDFRSTALQAGVRPALVVQNDRDIARMGNTIVVQVTTLHRKAAVAIILTCCNQAWRIVVPLRVKFYPVVSLSMGQIGSSMEQHTSPNLESRVQNYLATGSFPSVDAVLHSAMDALDERERGKSERWQLGNQIALEQSRKGLSKPLDDDAILLRLRSRLAEHGVCE
jgi:Arc/MetJ-type ribon-helix-helix transcriptional regulator